MSLPKILITHHVVDLAFDALTSRSQLVLPTDDAAGISRSEVLKHGAGLFGIINWSDLHVDAELLAAAPQLRIVANASAGFDNFDLPRMTESGVWATNAPETFADCTADLAFGLLLALARRIVRADGFVRTRGWPSVAERMAIAGGMSLRGKTLGIVGYGRIGRAVASRALAFGMKVIYYSSADPRDALAFRPLKALLAESDILSVHVPLNPSTAHLIDADCLRRMKPGALLVNVSRGRVVDEAALIDALRCGHLAGAALDVFEREPAVLEELIAMDNVVLTPHIGAAVTESQQVALRWCIDNVAAVLDGKEPREPLNQPRIVCVTKPVL